MQYEISAGVV